MALNTPVKVYSENKYCRLCAEEKDIAKSTNIFSTIGQKKELSNKINYTLGIHVEEKDGFPTLICRKCESSLLKFYNFKVTTVDIQSGMKKNVKVEEM